MIEQTYKDIKIKPNKVILSIPGEQKMVISSKLYQLKFKKSIKIFHMATNVGHIEDEATIQAFDKLEFEVGRCYTNTEKVVETFKQAGLGNYIQSMTGWLFVGPKPIHHCWAVYKEQYVIDPGANVSQITFQQKLAEIKKQPNREKSRQLLIEEQKRFEDEPNHQTKAFGEVFPGYMYIGSETTPDEGREIFSQLIKDYPDHPSYARKGMNAEGASKIQEMLKK